MFSWLETNGCGARCCPPGPPSSSPTPPPRPNLLDANGPGPTVQSGTAVMLGRMPTVFLAYRQKTTNAQAKLGRVCVGGGGGGGETQRLYITRHIIAATTFDGSF